jgi:NadR type nicotinamide-nucleotide adenylyltransferase
VEKKIIRIAITGPESTGKSWLSERLAQHFHTCWVPEYSREYLERLHHPYEETDILEIARGQFRNEEEMVKKANNILFCDTEFLVTLIWSEFRFGKCNPWIQTMFRNHMYSLYMLCDIDLPWENDPLREHPHQRELLFSLYRDALIEAKYPYIIISGVGENRLNQAIEVVKGRFF